MGTKTTAAVAAVMLLGTFAIYSTYLEQSSVLSTWKTAAPMKPADRVEAQNAASTELFHNRAVDFLPKRAQHGQSASGQSRKKRPSAGKPALSAPGAKPAGIKPADKPAGIKVAVAITVLSPLKERQGGEVSHFLDGAAVLATSVRLVSKMAKYPMELVAIVHPSVDALQRSILLDAGYIVVERAVAVKEEDIRGQTLRQQIVKSGCCGMAELLKIEAFTFTQYSHVLHLDADCVMIKPVDELFEMQVPFIYALDLSLTPKSFLPAENPELAEPDRYRDWYTRSITVKKAMLQGGFLLLKPDMQTYTEIVEVIREGNFVDGMGWGGTGVGWGYGGQTVQGVMPYFAEYKKGPEFCHVVDICIYDNMVDNPWCRAIPQAEIKIVHFTACQKPWYCVQQSDHNCAYARDWWWNVSRTTEAELLAKGAGEVDRKRCWKDAAADGQQVQAYQALKYPSVK